MPPGAGHSPKQAQALLAAPIIKRVKINPRKPPVSPDAMEQREKTMIVAIR
jgi:hypothetical protein